MLCITQGMSECGALSSCGVGGINMLCPISIMKPRRSKSPASIRITAYALLGVYE